MGMKVKMIVAVERTRQGYCESERRQQRDRGINMFAIGV